MPETHQRRMRASAVYRARSIACMDNQTDTQAIARRKASE